MRLAGIVLLVLCASWYHPIHVSVTNVDLDPGEGTMDLSVKIFADDFLGAQGGIPLNTHSLDLEAGSSQYATMADSASLSIILISAPFSIKNLTIST